MTNIEITWNIVIQHFVKVKALCREHCIKKISHSFHTYKETYSDIKREM